MDNMSFVLNVFFFFFKLDNTLSAEANNASSVVAQILGTVVAGKVGLQVFFTRKPVFQPVFNPKHPSNCDKHINSLKKLKKLFKKLKSTRNKKV
jgi:hypothetical protein